MSGKVILPKDVAEAITELRSDRGGNLNEYGVVTYLDDPKRHLSYPKLKVLYSYFLKSGKSSPIDLMQALVNGYEVEKSSEEELREYYEDLRKSSPGSLYSWEADGVLKTLSILGIKIEGVNVYD